MRLAFLLFFRLMRPAFFILVIFMVLASLVYPASVALVLHLIVPSKAQGSFIEDEGKIIGSKLIGQEFKNPKYFWGRPSATPDFPYNFQNSGGSNLAPFNPQLKEEISKRITLLKEADPENKELIPLELVTASGSGLDPHISPTGAYYQAPRIARLRSIALDKIHQLIEKHIEKRLFGFLGEKRINVLKLNLALNKLEKENASNSSP